MDYPKIASGGSSGVKEGVGGITVAQAIKRRSTGLEIGRKNKEAGK